MNEAFNDKITVKFSLKDDKAEEGSVIKIWRKCYCAPLVGDRVYIDTVKSVFIVTERYWINYKEVVCFGQFLGTKE